jgi:AcrR family transcriptional regulator
VRAEESRSNKKIGQTTKKLEIVPGRARTTPKSAETRGRIIRGARDALEIHGLGEITTRKIAAMAEVRLATLHYHFENKEDLLLAVLDDIIEEMTRAIAADAAQSGNLEKRIETLIRSAWRFAERTMKQQLTQFELTLYALRSKGSEWLAATQYARYVTFYCDVLRGGPSDAKQELSVADYDALGRFVLAGIDGLILQALAFNSTERSAAGVDALIAAACLEARRLKAAR